MKLGKDETQKIFLGVLVLIGLLYVYFEVLLAPLTTQEGIARDELKDLQPKIDAVNTAIKNNKSLKVKADQAEATLEQVKSLIPDGAPVAWFPPDITEFFKRQGVDKCIVRMGGQAADKNLTGFKTVTWAMEIPHVEVVQLAIAIAALENEHPLMEIGGLQIMASKENVQFQTANINLSTIIKE